MLIQYSSFSSPSNRSFQRASCKLPPQNRFSIVVVVSGRPGEASYYTHKFTLQTAEIGRSSRTMHCMRYL
jgi:hypothetical protein